MIDEQVVDGTPESDDGEVFGEYRRLLFAIAYRMLGSVMDAEDAVQETFLRWQQVAKDTVVSPKAYLTTTVTRLCIDHLRSARVRREEYVGPWLPEPILAEPETDAEGRIALDESLSLAFLMLLERLDPIERAVFLLRDVFDYEYREIAEIVGKSEANCRQIVHRARQHVASERRRFAYRPAEGERLTSEFVQACTTGDLQPLLSILTDDVIAWTDGGAGVRAARRPIFGADRVSRFLVGVVGQLGTGLDSHFAWVNGEPGFVNTLDGQVHSVVALEIVDGRIAGIRAVMNPDKLRHLRLPD